MHECAIFHRDLLKYYQLVNKPGVFLVRVAYSVTMKNFINDAHPRLLVPLRAVTPDALAKLMEAFKTIDEIPFTLISNLFLTGAIFQKDVIVDDLPVKGDQMLASFKIINDGRIVCDHLEQLPREELSFLNVDELFKFNSNLLQLIQNEKIDS